VVRRAIAPSHAVDRIGKAAFCVDDDREPTEEEALPPMTIVETGN